MKRNSIHLKIITHKFNIQEREVEEYKIAKEVEGDLLEKKIEVSGSSLSHTCEFTGLPLEG